MQQEMLALMEAAEVAADTLFVLEVLVEVVQVVMVLQVGMMVVQEVVGGVLSEVVAVQEIMEAVLLFFV